MAKTAANVPVTVVPGGDSYLNDARTKALCAQALKARPDAELIELDATSADQYAFDEAVSPSLLSDVAVVKLVNLQNADEKLAEALVTYTKQAAKDPNGSSVVICQHEGGVKGRKIIDQLVKAGARKEDVPDLKKPDAQLNFVLGEFEKRGRRVEPMAAQQLVSVLGGKTGELAAMCEQLCFDFDDNPMGLDCVNQYLTANPQVTGFAVADKAVEGKTAEAIVMMRAAVEQGTDPIALIGALAMKLRTIAKASAVRAGTISQAEAKTNPWVLKNAMRQLGGWTSAGLAHCIRMLAWADEQSKTNGGDPVYALERCIDGKTTFAQGFGAGLDITEPIVSPTFTIARELDGHFADGTPAHLVHVDAYRLGGSAYAPGQDAIGRLLDELESLGLDEELEDPGENTVVLMEWGEQMATALAPERLEIHIDRPLNTVSTDETSRADNELTSNGTRTVAFVPVGKRWAAFDLQ